MITLIAIINETYLRLRRDRIFLPAAFVGTGLLLLSGIASYWGVEEFFKILFDLGSTVFHLIGVIVAIFWGTKLIHDSRQEGSLEVDLASPIPRSTWIIGRFLGLTLALGLLAVSFLAGWQVIYWGYGMGWMGLHSFVIFSMLTMSWFVMGATAIFFATMTSQAIALFSSFWILICGLIAAPIYQSLSPETPDLIRQGVTWATAIWDLHYFNLFKIGIQPSALTADLILNRLVYGIALLGTILSASCIAFAKRDLQT